MESTIKCPDCQNKVVEEDLIECEDCGLFICKKCHYLQGGICCDCEEEEEYM